MSRCIPILLLLSALAVIAWPRHASAVSGDAPLITLSLSTGEVELGQPFFVYIEVSTSRGAEVSLPAEISPGPAFEVLARKRTVTHPGRHDLHTFELTLMAFELGDLEIAEIPILYGAEAGVLEVRTAASRVMVRSLVPLDRDELREVPPVAVVRRDMTRVYWTGGIALGFVAITLLAFLLYRRTPAVREPDIGPVIEPVERFRIRADDVEESLGRARTGTCRPQYVEMSEAMREYLGGALAISAMDATTSEIAESTLALEALEGDRDELIEWLQDCDLVKFAGYRAGPDEGRQALVQARRWVDRVERLRRREQRIANA